MTQCHGDEAGGVTVSHGRRIALVGSPNSGKTSLFNQLTGLRAKTGNYPGVTVGRTVGVMTFGENEVAVEDLPGTYSLDPISPDEQVVADVVHGNADGIPRPDVIVLVVDSTTLRRSISLVAQVLRLDLPTIVVLTMTDELVHRRGGIDTEALSSALSVPVVAVVAHRGVGMSKLRTLLESTDAWPRPAVLPPALADAADAWGISVLASADYVAPHSDVRTRRIDDVVLHPLWGVMIFFAVMFGFFQIIFTVATPLQDVIANALDWLGALVDNRLGHTVVGGAIGNGVIRGVGTVLQFLPQIMLLFLLIALLENVGYMSRAAFLMDRVMARTGLEGRAFVAMLSSLACAVPAIMATRTLPSSRDRIATIISAPLMTCSARLPVYTLLIGLLVAPDTRWWGLSAQGVTMFGLYLGGGIGALTAALVFKSTILRSDLLPFTMELPPYRFPSLNNVVIAMCDAAKVFLRKAGTVILAVSLALWILMNLPTRNAQIADLSHSDATAYVVEHSYAASLGKAVEPVFAPLGFDWRIDIALIGSLSAREVFVSTLGQVSAASNPTAPHQTLRAMTDEHRRPVFGAPTIIALLAYFMFALQCMSTVAVMRRETNSWRWPAFAFGYMFVLAWIAAWVARCIALGVGA